MYAYLLKRPPKKEAMEIDFVGAPKNNFYFIYRHAGVLRDGPGCGRRRRRRRAFFAR
jgi:hypothetical protein